MNSPAQFVTQARGLAQSGRYDAARAAYRQAIAAMPRNPELLLELGVRAGQHGDLATARRTLEKAMKLDRGDANVHFNLGQIAKQEGQNERAAQYFRQTLQLDPDYHEALFDLGECLYLGGHTEDALSMLDKAAQATPHDAEVHHVRALALDYLGRRVEAVAAYRRALELDPGHVNANLNLALVEAEAGALWVAQELVDKIEADPGIPPEGYALVARVLHLVGEQERAAAYVDRCLKGNINVTDALMTRANIAIDVGDFSAAEIDLRRVIAKSGDPARAYYRLAFIRRLEPEAASRLKRWGEDAALPAGSRASACFALYSLLDRAGDYDRAFEVLERANAFKAQISPANTRQQVDMARRIAKTFTPDFMAERASWGCQKPGAVYIVGMPRSGTTLTEQILAAHPRIFAGGERPDVARTRMQIANWPEGVAALDAPATGRLGAELYATLTAKRGEEDFATDKAPGNYVFLGLIHNLLPQAKLVYVRRHPGANMLSLYERNFLRGPNYSYNLNDIVETYRGHVATMQHWISTCRLPVHTVDYEALVTDPEPHIRALLDYVGVEFHPDCLKPEQVERVVKTASIWQVRQPITTASIDRWKRYERQLGPYVRALEESPCNE